MNPLNEDPWFPSLTPTDPLNENPWNFPTNPAEDWSDESSLQPITEEDTVGDFLPPSKPPNTTRVYFINVNGISYGATGGDFATIGKTAADHGIDILGIAETHLDTTRFPVREVLRKAALHNIDTKHVKLVTASSNRQYNSYRKPGGTLLMTQGHTTGRCQKSFSDDMGRWCSTTYSGQNGRQLTVISAYQVCDSPPVADTSNQTTTTMKTKAVTQQYSMMVEKGLPLDRHPRTQFCLDLSDYITELKNSGHLILLMGDFNEVLGDNPAGIETVAQAGGLQDLLANRIGRTDFSTFIRGSKRIDFILASPEVVAACTAAGYDPYNFRFQGDHRGMYLDLDTIALFGNETPGLTPPSQRILQSRHRKNRLKYLQAKYDYLTGHNWFDRLASFTETSDVTLLESLDRDWVRSGIQAEKKCTRHHPAAFVKRLVELRNQRIAVRIRISELRNRKRMSGSRHNALDKCSPNFTLPTTLLDLCSLLNSINTEIQQLETNDKISRATEQAEAKEARLAAGDIAGAKALRNIIIAEETREMWKQIRSMEDASDQGVTTVQIPADGDLSNLNCKTCEAWINLDQPEAIREALIQRNKLHFGQAHGTFPTKAPFSEKITWEADTPFSDMLLDGNIPFSDDEIDDISRLFLKQFQKLTDLDSIPATITKAEWVGKMKVWNEATTTSPSGLHLGHHKCLIREIDIPQEGSASDKVIEELEELESHREKMLAAQITLINHAITRKHVFERWKKVANFMIFKEPGNTKIHRLRVIHLYEADLNLILGVKWRALTHHGIDNHLFSKWQFGGLPGRDALTPVLLEDIQMEISRASNTTLCCTDFDATSCYDRIIPSIASLAGRSFGQNQVLCFVHARFLAEAKYLLKTKLGISEEAFSHCTPYPIYGNGQGSGNGPPVWGMISSKLLAAHETKAHGATFMRPDRSQRTKVCMRGFIDDVNSTVNRFEASNQSLTAVLPLVQHDAQLWNDLLDRSGGALEGPKCALHVATYDFTPAGKPIYKHFQHDPPSIQIQTDPSSAPTQLKYLSPFATRKTLGCYKSPSGGHANAFKVISKNAQEKSTKVLASRLVPVSANRYFRGVFFPSVTYSLPVTTIPERNLAKLQSQTYRRFLPKLGYNRNMPAAVVHGPSSLGGLDMCPLYEEQGASKIQHFLKHWRSQSEVSNLLRIMMSWVQKYSGVGTPILQRPNLALPHLERFPFITSMREFLSKINGHLDLDEKFEVPLQRENDEHLMELVVASQLLTPKEIVLFNYCQHFLEVYTLSDISEANGQYVDEAFLCRQPTHTHLSKSLHLPVRQPRPTCTRTWAAWRKAQQIWCNPATRKLKVSLGKWLHYSPQLRRSWKYNWDPTNNVLISVEMTTGSLEVHLPLPSSIGHFYLHPSATIQELPQNSFPVSCQPRLTSLKITRRQEGVLPPVTTHPQEDFEGFLSSQAPWIQDILKHLEFKVDFEEAIASLTSQTAANLGASDGSVKFQNGTWGWALASPSGEVMIECKGPAYGIVMDSYRAESYGLLSITTLVTLLLQYTTNNFAPIELLCDNEALVKKVEKMWKSTRPTFPNDTLAPSWDVLQRIIMNLKKFPEESSIRWIPSHQDSKTPVEKLPPAARLNVHADKLAAQFQQQSPNHQHNLDPPMIDGAGCHLVINDYIIASKHKRTARDVLREKALLRYIQEKYKWTDHTIQGIDWDSHKQAVNSWTYAHRKESLTRSPPTFLRKFLHGWLATGKMVSRYNATLYPKECQSCQHPIEDQTHFLKCSARADWRNKFRDALRKHSTTAETDPMLTEIMLEGIIRWLTETPYPNPHHRLPPQYQELHTEQSTIGWDQLLYGRWSRHWRTLQQQHLIDNNIPCTPRNSDISWMTGHITLIWNELYGAWKLRNQDRHGKEEEIQRQIKLNQVKRQIRVLYNLQPLCNLTNHRKWFYATPDEHFLREPSLTQLQNWVTTYDPMIRARARIQQQLNQHGLTAIDEAFEHANSLGP